MKIKLLFISTLILASSCIKQEGLGREADILSASIEEEGFIVSTIHDDIMKREVSLIMAGNINKYKNGKITPTIAVSKGATIHPQSGETVTLEDYKHTYVVTAEDGGQKAYELQVTQYPPLNQDFEKWELTKTNTNKPYEVPADPLWDCGNSGVYILIKEGQLDYALNHQWSLESGITIDVKGMGVRNRVKYMYTSATMDDNTVRGYFTGRNETKVKASYVTIPVRIAYSLTETWKIRAGGYFSYKNSSEFSGTVWDGYLRQTDDKDIINSILVDIDNKDEAVFDFGKDMRNFDMGLSVGFEHNFKNFKGGRISLYGDMTVSLTPLFPSDFTAIDMTMRHMYAVVGLSYKL